MEIRRGQRLSMAQLCYRDSAGQAFQLVLSISGVQGAIDFACFGLDSRQKLSDDRYMTFYNQPDSPCGGVKIEACAGNSVRFLCDLAVLPESVDRLVFTAALNSSEVMRDIQSGYLCFLVANQEVARFSFSGADFQDEKALMLGEIYRKDHEWRFSAAGQGFNGGLAALVAHFGGEVVEDLSPPVSQISLEKKIAALAPKLVDLAKKATISLEKHRLSSTVAQVGLVLDASGSMYAQYDKGKVQQVVERLLPLAVHFDDDEALDVWAFSNNALALPPATLQNYTDYIVSAEYGWRNWGMMSVNNEPAVIEKVIQYYQNAKLPVLIIFISDGGVNQNAAIKKLLVDAARLPIFWQFVGIGGRNYGVLEKLDTMPGRVVDNCGFFALDDLNSVSEQVLYERLLGEFPLWLEAAKLKGIVL
jgi:stress response protein SCP2